MSSKFTSENLVNNCMFTFGVLIIFSLFFVLAAVIWPLWVIHDMLFNKNYRKKFATKLRKVK